MRKEVLAMLLTVLMYSMMALAYVHANFPNKDSFNMLVDDVKYIRKLLDERSR